MLSWCVRGAGCARKSSFISPGLLNSSQIRNRHQGSQVPLSSWRSSEAELAAVTLSAHRMPKKLPFNRQRAVFSSARRPAAVDDTRSEDGSSEDIETEQQEPGGRGTIEMDSEMSDASQLATIAQALWLPSYDELFAAELRTNRALLGRMDSVVSMSLYRRRLQGEVALKYDRKQEKQERDRLAIELHGQNMRHWSPSLVARSICYVRLTTAWMHSVETGQRRCGTPPRMLK